MNDVIVVKDVKQASKEDLYRLNWTIGEIFTAYIESIFAGNTGKLKKAIDNSPIALQVLFEQSGRDLNSLHELSKKIMVVQ